MLKRFWVSWCQYTDDYRSLNWPMNKSIINYWCSGYSGEIKDNGYPLYSTLCALVEAESKEQAIAALLIEWPECTEKDWRFFEEKPIDWIPGDRFKM